MNTQLKKKKIFLILFFKREHILKEKEVVAREL